MKRFYRGKISVWDSGVHHAEDVITNEEFYPGFLVDEQITEYDATILLGMGHYKDLTEK